MTQWLCLVFFLRRHLGIKISLWLSFQTTLVVSVANRGGVEDTRLKAKDTKKIRGQVQGQLFRRQTLSRPRTGLLEAKDQEHSRKCSPNKKKGYQKTFSGYLQFIGVARIFDWGAQITNHMQWRHQNFSKEELFVGQRYRRMEDLKLLLVDTLPGFWKERALKLIIEKCKYLTLKTCLES